MRKAFLIAIVAIFAAVFTPQTSHAQPVEASFLSIADYLVARSNVTLLDVRSKNSRANSQQGIEGEVWIDPHSGDALNQFVGSADKSKPYVIFCSCVDDNYSVRAAQILTKNGFELVFVLRGGWDSLKSVGIEMIPLQ
ncbi:rhodanese-like domain-containing protein [Azotosporobacter soli]|uniref:rhodanese-like domain-containing protein n=1 Tax=Azotosporobacter soli TaxID=3055040 RepID=UPI0031FE76C5